MVTLKGEVPGLSVGCINPKVKTRKYVDKIVAAQSPGLTPAELDLLVEDLRSPCTGEVAVFYAFSHVVAQARSAFVMPWTIKPPVGIDELEALLKT